MSNQLKFEIIGESESGQAAFRKLSNAAEDTHGHMGKLRTVMAGVFAGNLLTEGASKAVEFLKSSVEAAVEDQRAEAMLTQTLHNSAGATDAQTEAVKRRLLADGEHLGIMQDQMMPAFQKLVMVTHSTTQATGLLTLTENLAAAKHIQLSDAASLVAKMTMGSNRAFKEFGITVQNNSTSIMAVTKAQQHLVFVQNEVSSGALSGKKAISALASAHQALTSAQFKAKEAMASVHAGLQKVAEFTKGDAAKAADTYAGRLAQMHVRFHDLQVTIGNAVLPVLTELLGFIMQKAVPALSAMGHWVQQNQAWLVPLIAAIGAIIIAVKTWTLALALLNLVLNANPVMLVIVAIIAFVAALVVAYTKVKWFHDLVNTAFHAIAAVVGFVVDFIKQHWLLMLNIITGGMATPVAFIIRNWGAIQNAFGTTVGWIKNAWNGLVAFFGGTVGAVGSIFSKIGGAIKAVFGSVFGWAISAFQSMFGSIISAINAAIGAAKAVGNAVKSGGSGILGNLAGVHIPGFAEGGIVMPSAGGSIVRVAEAGHAEAIIPLDGKHGLGGTTIAPTFNVAALPGSEHATAREIQRLLVKMFRESGNTQLASALAGAGF